MITVADFYEFHGKREQRTVMLEKLESTNREQWRLKFVIYETFRTEAEAREAFAISMPKRKKSYCQANRLD